MGGRESGRMAGCWRLEGWKDGRIWEDGRMAGYGRIWKDGRGEGWENRRMEGLKDCRI